MVDTQNEKSVEIELWLCCPCNVTVNKKNHQKEATENFGGGGVGVNGKG